MFFDLTDATRGILTVHVGFSEPRSTKKTLTKDIKPNSAFIKPAVAIRALMRGQNEARRAPSGGGPPDALLMSRVSRSISPPVAIKEAP